MADWSSLPSDALSVITDHLAFGVDVQFRLVCRSWRAACPVHRPTPPYLIAHRRDDSNGLSFFNLNGSHSRSLGLSSRCRGSSHGWLALLDPNGDPSVSLFHPYSRRQIKLPNFSARNYFLDDPAGNVSLDAADKIICSSEPLRSTSSSSLSSPSNCVIVAVRNDWKTLEFCKIGDEVWTPIRSSTFEGVITDVIFYRGLLYIASCKSLYVCDVHNEESPIVRLEVVWWMGSLLDECHFVEFLGDLLVVTLSFGTNKMYDLRVYRINMRVDSLILQTVRGLSDGALFISHFGSFSVCSGASHCRSNVVYLVERYMENQTLIRIFSLSSDETRCQLIENLAAESGSSWRACGWFTAS